MKKRNPFHLAVPVYDLEKCRHFYREIIGCEEGRSSANWVDFDFFGHQFVIHKVPEPETKKLAPSNPVDGKEVPVPHFGVVLDWDDWHVLQLVWRRMPFNSLSNHTFVLKVKWENKRHFFLWILMEML